MSQAQPGAAAAEQFLNDTLMTLKTEPVEVSLSSLPSKPQPYPKQPVHPSYPILSGPSDFEQARVPYSPKQNSFAPPPASISQRTTNSNPLQWPAAGPERVSTGTSTLQGLLKELDEEYHPVFETKTKALKNKGLSTLEQGSAMKGRLG